jgi:hypothetical protein
MGDGGEEVKAAETGKKKQNRLKRGDSDGEIKFKGEGIEGKTKIT